MNKSNKYPNGYLPKIEYWHDIYIKAAEEEMWNVVEASLKKLTYFVSKQRELDKSK